MGRHLGVAVAESLQDPDLLALDVDQAREHGMQEIGGDEDEHRRDDGPDRPQLLELAVEEGVALVVLAVVGPQAPVAVEELVERVDHVLARRSVGERHARLVEGALEVEGRLEGLALHPEHAVAAIVRHQTAGRQHVGELRR